MNREINKNSELIKPLFLSVHGSNEAVHQMTAVAQDDYNKATGEVLIDAKNDGQAVITFLQEYRDSAETLRSYTKEVERLLLWCFHVGYVNISSLRREHLFGQSFSRR
jgi:hypothetical protein